MADAAEPTPAEQSRTQIQLTGLFAGGALILNALFFFLSRAYFDDRAKRFGPAELEGIDWTRLQFLIFTLVILGLAVATIFAPRAIAFVIAGIVSIAGFLAAYGAVSRSLPGVLAVCGILVGGAVPMLAWGAHQKSRAAWSALTSTLGVLAVVMLFGAARVRGLLGGGLWLAMIVPGVLAVGTAALVRIRRDYRE